MFFASQRASDDRHAACTPPHIDIISDGNRSFVDAVPCTRYEVRQQAWICENRVEGSVVYMDFFYAYARSIVYCELCDDFRIMCDSLCIFEYFLCSIMNGIIYMKMCTYCYEGARFSLCTYIRTCRRMVSS